MEKLRLILTGLLLIILLAGCNGDAQGNKSDVTEKSAREDKSVLTMALGVDPDGLDPHRTSAAATFQITNNIYDTLIKVTPEGELEPRLAESWNVSEDGMTITFKLREGVKFHNGRPVTAADVKFSFERLKDDESPRAGVYENIVEINVIDEQTIEFVTGTLDVALETLFVYPWTAIIPEEEIDNLRDKPVGTGPYRLEEWIPQQHIILKRNDDYFDPAHIETIEFLMMPDPTSQISALQSGQIDMIVITGDQAGPIENSTEFNIIETEYNAIQLMAMNTEHEALSDVRVRQAINYAVDKDAVIDTVWFGYGNKIGSHYPPILKGYVDTTDVISYDPDKAKELLKEAGYGDGLTLDMYLPSAYPMYVSAGQVIADQLREVGITANIHTVEWGVWLSDIYTNRQYDLTVVGHTGRLDPFALLARYQSDSGENYMNYSNERVDEILASVQQERDEEKRLALYGELQHILAEEVPAVYLQSPIAIAVTAKDVAGFQSYPIDIYEMKDVYYTE